MDFDDHEGGGEAPPPPPAGASAAMAAFGGGGGGGGMNAGVLAMVSKAASTLQRNGEKGEVRNADAEAVPYLAMEEILERLKILNYEREMPGSFRPLTHTYFAIASGNPTE